MWLLFHRNTKTRAVPDGEQFVETCPSCKTSALFIEVQLEENIGLFFVDMLGDQQRAFRCTSCLETFEHKDALPEAEGAGEPSAIEPPRSAYERERERRQELLRQRTQEKLAEKRATPEDRRSRAARAIAEEIEAELVAIHDRLGR